jgi:TRAP-type C4-dicarboxylate transport system permease small subunit
MIAAFERSPSQAVRLNTLKISSERNVSMSRLLERIEHIILTMTAAVMAVIAFTNVITRYFLNHSLAFTEELTINLFVLLTFVGAAVGLRKHAHLGFTLLFEKSSLPLQKLLTVVTGVMMAVMFALFMYYGIEMVQFQMMVNQTTPALGWPQWIFSLSLPFGSALCLWRTVEATVKEFKQLHKEGGRAV